MHYFKRLFKDESRLTISALILVLATAVVIGALDVTERVRAQAQLNFAQVLGAQQTAVTPDMTVSVKDISENNLLDPAFTLDDSQTMLIMTISITNNTSAEQDLLPVANLFMRTRDGQYSPLHPSLYIKTPLPSGKIKPGQTLTGQISFGVPKQAAHPLLYVDPGWNDAVPVVFDVLKN